MQSIPRIRTSSPKRHGEKGFTILELLVSSLVLVIMIGGVVMVLDISTSLYNKTQQGLDLQQNVRSALNFVTRELINAGSGMPYISNVNGTPPANTQLGAKLGPLGAALTTTTVDFLTPSDDTGQQVEKDGEGNDLPTPVLTDMLTFLGGMGDSRFVDQTLPGPTANWGAEVYMEDNTVFRVGEVVLITNGFQVSLGQITGVQTDGRIQFSSGSDPLGLNPTASSGNPNPNYDTALQIPGGPPPQVLPLSSITYFIDSATNPARPSLKRVSNEVNGTSAAKTVSDDIEDFQVQYLVDADANATTPDVELDNPTLAQIPLVRGLTVTVTGRSRVRMADAAYPDGHNRLTLSQKIFFRNNIRR